MTYKQRIQNNPAVDEVHDSEFYYYDGDHPIFIYLKEGWVYTRDVQASDKARTITAYSWRDALYNMNNYVEEV